MSDPPQPYLSVVATARNDDHGGNLLHRMQVFVSTLIAQAERHHVSLELVLVEWNPPPDRPRLAEALQWPEDLGPSSVRIIEVPETVHRRYKHAAALPLYQMIAKNVGIRRARGRFVLATNIDIVFSDELFRFLSEHRLELGRMYRVDRHDVAADVPARASVDEVLEYCRTHRLRLNAREGTFRLTQEGLRSTETDDVVDPEAGVYFGPGWFPPESHGGERFRWAGIDAEVILKPPGDDMRSLVLLLEPGPGVGYKSFQLEIHGSSGETLGRFRIDGRTSVWLRPPSLAGQAYAFRLRVLGGGLKVPHDPRAMNFRLFRCVWETDSEPSAGAGVTPVPASRSPAFTRRVGVFLSRGLRVLVRLCRGGKPFRIGLPVSSRCLRKLQLRFEGAGLSLVVAPDALKRKLTGWLPFAGRRPVPDTAVGEAACDDSTVVGAEHLHTNGCGDFTLLPREQWLDLRGYPEFDLFSMNIDSVFCYAAHHGGAREELLEEPIRIYHIEHKTGSGWTPEGQNALFERITATGLSWIDNQEVIEWARQMNRLGVPMIFNGGNWGIAEVEFPETILPPPTC